MVERVVATEKAVELIGRLKAAHGALLFHQSGGCCDGSSAMCFPLNEFRTGPSDVLLGEIAGCPVYIGAEQFELWSHTQLIIDVVKGRGAGFSLESPEGVRFLTRGHVFTEAETKELAPLQPHAAA
ncbi:UDP-glucose 4-epimerase [Methylocella tundrae]|uniref:UDP-glucose 4-epimerase n=1 Tax=Methylocella tundrae TaxID=227605 RepID=A0A4U8Z5U1_METTU|nr:DUF779 domain-containing protein [Methylocella tundrae]WPP04509.1 DUF779 domain-containing protein [Methylocella tundrae]VFU10910.1 UDP-glucose 4-epimerase [Methylocella tundrae]VTZ49806.1 UDP-glucose 4-epimerase [Methylocella tundrae]